MPSVISVNEHTFGNVHSVHAELHAVHDVNGGSLPSPLGQDMQTREPNSPATHCCSETAGKLSPISLASSPR